MKTLACWDCYLDYAGMVQASEQLQLALSRQLIFVRQGSVAEAHKLESYLMPAQVCPHDLQVMAFKADAAVS